MSGGNAYKRKSHRRIEAITSVAAVVVLYVILESFGVTCPIKYITGISCAGCGMSRAWIALLHFNIHEAFMYHPLFFLPPVVVIVMLLKSKINIKIYKIIISFRLFFCLIFWKASFQFPEGSVPARQGSRS